MVFLLSEFLYAQDIYIHSLIGKNISDVTKKFGKPSYKDDSNPGMICMFYKYASGNMVFVSDKDGVYQAEASISYGNEKSARDAVDKVIQTSLTEGFTTDTVTVYDFKLHRSGVNTVLQVCENKISGKFNIRVNSNSTMN